MTEKIKIHELSIVVVANNHNPTILNPDFLKYNEIVSKDWEVSGQTICTPAASQVSYKNGVSIVAQFDKVIFAEKAKSTSDSEFKIPSIAKKYIETLKHVDYRAVGINPKGHIEGSDATNSFVLDKFVANGPWKKFKGIAPAASVIFRYQIEKCLLALTVEHATLQDDQNNTPVILFSGNFHTDIKVQGVDEKLKSLIQIIEKWKADIEVFKKFSEEVLG